MTITEALLKEVDSGREGKAQGYSMGLPKTESIIDGVTKRTMTVIASGTGQGKSSFVLYEPTMDSIRRFSHLLSGS